MFDHDRRGAICGETGNFVPYPLEGDDVLSNKRDEMMLNVPYTPRNGLGGIRYSRLFTEIVLLCGEDGGGVGVSLVFRSLVVTFWIIPEVRQLMASC